MARPKKDPKPVLPPSPGDGPMPIKQDQLEQWVDAGICCKYVKFKDSPVPTGEDKEPVWEFKLKSIHGKYLVNSIFYTPHGVVFSAHGEMGVVPIGNVAHVRPI